MDENGTVPAIRYDFGTFDGGYWPTDYTRFEDPVPTSEILGWRDYDPGEAEFWPAGDKPEMTLLFDGEQRRITDKEQLLALSKLLDHLGGDSAENYLRIRHALNRLGVDICALPYRALDALPVHIFVGTELAAVEDQAVGELAKCCPGHHWAGPATEARAFLDGLRSDPAWGLETVTFGDKVALLVWPEPRRSPER
jgi:hypothetical protein